MKPGSEGPVVVGLACLASERSVQLPVQCRLASREPSSAGVVAQGSRRNVTTVGPVVPLLYEVFQCRICEAVMLLQVLFNTKMVFVYLARSSESLRVATRGRPGEHGGLADVVEPHKQHHHTLEANAGTAVGRGSQGEGIHVMLDVVRGDLVRSSTLLEECDLQETGHKLSGFAGNGCEGSKAAGLTSCTRCAPEVISSPRRNTS